MTKICGNCGDQMSTTIDTDGTVYYYCHNCKWGGYDE